MAITKNWRDRCMLICSPLGGYSLLREPFVISYLDDEGKLVEAKVHEIAKNISEMGFNGVREFPFWIHDSRSFEMIVPFKFNGWRIFFDEIYFENWKRIATIYNSYGLKLYFSLFEGNAPRVYPGLSPWKPLSWDKPPTAFYGGSLEPFRSQWIKKVVKNFQDNKNVVGYEICNEPQFTGDVTPTMMGEFLAATFIDLIYMDVPFGDVNIGIQYSKKEENSANGRRYASAYRAFRNTVGDTNGSMARMLKTTCVSPCHDMSMGNAVKLLKDARSNGVRNMLFSTDGVRDGQIRPGWKELYDIFSYIFAARKKASLQGRTHIECVYPKTHETNPDECRGAIEAYRMFFDDEPFNIDGREGDNE